jgi:hypothetical protein
MVVAGNARCYKYRTLIVRWAIRIWLARLKLERFPDGAGAGANLGEKLGVKGSNRGPFLLRIPDLSRPSGYTGRGGSGRQMPYRSGLKNSTF